MNYYLWVAYVQRVIDGDTIVVIAETLPGSRTQFNVRLDGVDTPEMRGKERPQGIISTRFVRSELAQYEFVVLESYGDYSIGNRLVGDILYGADSPSEVVERGHRLSNVIISGGYGKKYIHTRSGIDDSPIQPVPVWI